MVQTASELVLPGCSSVYITGSQTVNVPPRSTCKIRFRAGCRPKPKAARVKISREGVSEGKSVPEGVRHGLSVQDQLQYCVLRWMDLLTCQHKIKRTGIQLNRNSSAGKDLQ